MVTSFFFFRFFIGCCVLESKSHTVLRLVGMKLKTNHHLTIFVTLDYFRQERGGQNVKAVPSS